MNYYPRHIGDYIGATAHLSMVEDGAYNRLLDWYYLDEAPIPNDRRAIYRRCRASSDDDRNAIDAVLNEFFTLDPDANAFRHFRADDEIAKYRDKSAKATKSAKARWHANASESHANASESHANASKTHSATHCVGNANQEPITNNQEDQKKEPREKSTRAAPLARPDGVSEQIWADWLALRKAKRAPVTQTVLTQATAEAGKAGMPLERFLGIWCARGSQGLQADWLRPNERAGPAGSKPSATQNFRGKIYEGTPDDQLPAGLRASQQIA